VRPALAAEDSDQFGDFAASKFQAIPDNSVQGVRLTSAFAQSNFLYLFAFNGGHPQADAEIFSHWCVSEWIAVGEREAAALFGAAKVARIFQ
jgi:hypothetical protein